MPYYKIYWETTSGKSMQEVWADNKKHAENMALHAWRDEYEAIASYGAQQIPDPNRHQAIKEIKQIVK
jgi:hypothetical protein